jgi:hypothetical protein
LNILENVNTSRDRIKPQVTAMKRKPQMFILSPLGVWCPRSAFDHQNRDRRILYDIKADLA